MTFSFLKFVTYFKISFMFLCAADIDKFYYQVIASRTKIYIILEYITGGELFDKIVSRT